MRTEECNVCTLLIKRSSGLFSNGAGTINRKNLKILRKLLCQDTTTFKWVWTKQSKCPIAYERGRIYFDNYRSCFSCTTSVPGLLYEIPKCNRMEKIEDALLCECPVGETLPRHSDYGASLIALTANNWLVRLSANTGEVLEKVYLSSDCKFRYVTWEAAQETVVVKSAHIKGPARSTQTGSQHSLLLYLAVFKVLPLSVVGMLEINKKIFGNTVTDATVSHGVLIIMHSTGLVRLYSFQWIIHQFMEKELNLRQECIWNFGNGIVGGYPFGIPCNIRITESPPVLFEVSSLESALQIGGYPWHYIMTPNKKTEKGIYHICALKDNKVATNGIQDMQCCSLESDWIYFHPDESGRIVHVGPTQINVLKLTDLQNESGDCLVTEDFIIQARREPKVNPLVTVTTSGRVVKTRFSQLDDDPEFETFKNVDYEDELDLLATVKVTQAEMEGVACLTFYNNQNGSLIKTLPLLESWDVTYSHGLFFDRDTIVHIEQKPNRIFCCYVYKMICGTPEEEKESKRSGRRSSLYCAKRSLDLK
ncbi:DDB1- and CUL4-associated factor 17 [Protopterus annectens]|uniref:DDB1- and CUL4-associated factor 17 n=1 Tax=Protopterus annectens TaxID=7888 RepID=UPI001CF99560|nr:DDB1- and CUL4-associated factor 17 [Protopterus annectens]